MQKEMQGTRVFVEWRCQTEDRLIIVFRVENHIYSEKVRRLVVHGCDGSNVVLKAPNTDCNLSEYLDVVAGCFSTESNFFEELDKEITTGESLENKLTSKHKIKNITDKDNAVVSFDLAGHKISLSKAYSEPAEILNDYLEKLRIENVMMNFNSKAIY